MTVPEFPVAKKVFIKTFGCQMNEVDSGKMRALLAADGYTAADRPEDADLVVVNTCSIREKPEQKLHDFLGRVRPMKKERPVMLAVAGCVAQQEGAEIFRRYRDVDLVFGPDGVPQVRALVAEAQTRRVLDTSPLDSLEYPFVSDVDPTTEGQVGAFVTIQKGCDNKCTFCIVPTTRGVEVSRPSGEILAEVRALVARGVREVTLLGQNVNSYGLKVPGEKTFAELLRGVADVPGVLRIRYTTSHPRDMGLDVIAAYRDVPQLADHLHLPLQSGSDAVLRRMKRFYRRDDYLRVVDALREARPTLVLSTDFIVGFPGETDADFEDTLKMLDGIGYESSYSFKFSPRPGTAALRLGDAVPDDVASERLTILQARQREIGVAAHERLVGRVLDDVLVEGPSRHDAGGMCGRTSAFKTVNFTGGPELLGQTVSVRVTQAFVNTLKGERAA